jgi:hypothetical protein
MLIKKRRKFFFFFPKFDIGWVEMRDNQIYFLFRGQFHIGFVRQAGYKKTIFFIIYPQSKKGSYQTHNKIGKKDKDKIGKKDKVSRPDPLNDASIRYSDI